MSGKPDKVVVRVRVSEDFYKAVSIDYNISILLLCTTVMH